MTALEPVLKEHGGIWLGSVEGEESAELRSALEEAARDVSFRYVPVSLTKEEQANYYEGFSNEVLWPLFHDLQSLCVFNPEYWEFYKRVNRKFAEAAHREAGADDIIWVQDYQLLLVGQCLREMRPVGTAANEKTPAPFDTEVRVSPLASFLSTTVALGITAPVASVTTPPRVAVVVCAPAA